MHQPPLRVKSTARGQARRPAPAPWLLATIGVGATITLLLLGVVVIGLDSRSVHTLALPANDTATATSQPTATMPPVATPTLSPSPTVAPTPLPTVSATASPAPVPVLVGPKTTSCVWHDLGDGTHEQTCVETGR